MLTIVAVYTALMFGAAKVSKTKRGRELGRSIMGGLVGLSTFTRGGRR